MTKPIIHLALTHDWELRGNGSGDIEQIQFAPMRELLRIYERFAVRTTFCPDVAQQLAFRRLQDQHPQLKRLANIWDDHLVDAFRRGHDVQLHLHPQWRGATYEEGKWHLTADWSILNYEEAIAREMVFAAKHYLESLLLTVDPRYKCVAFRAGALAVAPSHHLLAMLIELGLKLDVSLAGGLFVDTLRLKLDYRNCEERVLPFFPQLDDARQVSPNREEITCVPIHSFYSSRRQILAHQVDLASRKVRQRLARVTRPAAPVGAEYATNEWVQKGRSSLPAQVYDKGIAPYFKGRYVIADIARLSYPLLREMLESIREKSALAGQENVPIVVTNHPKEIHDFRPIERFVSELAHSDDIKFITLAELSAKLQQGAFQIRRAQA